MRCTPMTELKYPCGCTQFVTCSGCERHIRETGEKMDAQFARDAPAQPVKVKLYDVEGEDADGAAGRYHDDIMRGPDGGW